MSPKFVLMLLAPLLVTRADALDTTKLGQLGSLLPEEKQALFAKSPKLKGEADAEMSKRGLKIEDVVCDGMRFPGSWEGLAGERVVPYRCQFGERWLKIVGKVVVTGKGGKVYPQIDRTAMKRATKAKETDLIWSWSDIRPSEP